MTKDKLEKEAGESWWNDNNCSGALSTEKIYICGYLASAEPREKRIAELEAQIEKMKCCENCKRYKPCVTCNETIGNNCDYYSGGNVCDKWEIKENE